MAHLHPLALLLIATELSILYRITEELKALEECGAGGSGVAALKERLAAIRRRQSEITRETNRFIGEQQ